MAGFQSTRPARGATESPQSIASTTRFNPRAPRGARRPFRAVFGLKDGFQSTRPARGATTGTLPSYEPWLFQSTRPARGATAIRPPIVVVIMFQSTRPARGAT